MTRNTFLRLAQVPVVLFVISVMVFAALRVLPGDVIDTITDGTPVTPETRATLERELGLDEPLPVQYFEWMRNAVRFDFGTSLRNGSPVADDLRDRLPRTLQLSIMALIVSTVFGVASGVISAVRRGSVTDYSFRLFSLIGLAVPLFFIQSLVRNYLLPKFFGWVPPPGYEDFWEDPLRNLEQMWLPALLLGLAFSAYTSRLTRSAMLDVLNEDYVRTARAKGLGQRTVIIRHAFRNAMLPVITLTGLQLGVMFSGTVITESIFGIPGMGRYLIDAVASRDYPVVQSGILISAGLFLTINLLVDLLYSRVDPRVGASS